MRSNSHTHAPQSDIGLAPYITLGPMTTQVLRYHDGATVQLGDIVDLGFGSGPTARVVVTVPTSEAAPGFIADEWSSLKQGVLLQDTKLFGLLHVDTLDCEYLSLRRSTAGSDEA